MPCIPEYQVKIDEWLNCIGEYANVLPYHPDNKQMEEIISTRIYMLKSEIDKLIKNESDELKRYVSTIYSQYKDMEGKWDIAEDVHLNIQNGNQ